MSKTETQSEALDAETRLLITAAAHLEMRKKFGDEGFKMDLERDEAEAIIETIKKSRRLDAENKALRADAERHRWLRIQPDDCSAPRIDICRWTCDHGDSVNNGEGLRGDAADRAIDAAMAAAKTGDAA